MDNAFVNILVIDTQRMLADALENIIINNCNSKKIDTATSAEEGICLITSKKYSLVITDIGLPKMNGLELIKKIKEFNINIPCLILSMHISRELVKESLRLEAEGYMLKTANKLELITAIDRIIEGGNYYGSEICNIMMDLLKNKEQKKPKIDKEITARELEVLLLICRELSSKQIASELSISTCTVETHRRSLFKKTKSKNVIGLIRFAIKNKLAIWD